MNVDTIVGLLTMKMGAASVELSHELSMAEKIELRDKLWDKGYMIMGNGKGKYWVEESEKQI